MVGKSSQIDQWLGRRSPVLPLLGALPEFQSFWTGGVVGEVGAQSHHRRGHHAPVCQMAQWRELWCACHKLEWKWSGDDAWLVEESCGIVRMGTWHSSPWLHWTRKSSPLYWWGWECERFGRCLWRCRWTSCWRDGGMWDIFLWGIHKCWAIPATE